MLGEKPAAEDAPTQELASTDAKTLLNEMLREVPLDLQAAAEPAPDRSAPSGPTGRA